jgi:hypothetical protein
MDSFQSLAVHSQQSTVGSSLTGDWRLNKKVQTCPYEAKQIRMDGFYPVRCINIFLQPYIPLAIKLTNLELRIQNSKFNYYFPPKILI